MLLIFTSDNFAGKRSRILRVTLSIVFGSKLCIFLRNLWGSEMILIEFLKVMGVCRPRIRVVSAEITRFTPSGGDFKDFISES